MGATKLHENGTLTEEGREENRIGDSPKSYCSGVDAYMVAQMEN